MKRAAKPKAVAPTSSAEERPNSAEERPSSTEERQTVLERPDGFYWIAESSGREYGPFRTLGEAELDMLSAGGGNELEPGESLQEAESELGVSEWIDPDTGGPAEDHIPRLEDH